MGLLVNTMRTETNRATSVREEIEALRHMTVGQLKDKYREVFDESSRSNHKQFLFRRIAWRLQANAWGGLSERARRRAREIANDADLRIRAPRDFLKEELDERRAIETRVAATEDPRLPIPGTLLVRRYRSKDVIVRVREDGFEYDGQVHRSLSSAVRAATGTPWNGDGWALVPTKYSDGGYTGANIERPGVRQLLIDIEAGKVDCVVVYKIDRLSRSLIDFVKMMELFERRGVCFVSTTQQFNTNTRAPDAEYPNVLRRIRARDHFGTHA